MTKKKKISKDIIPSNMVELVYTIRGQRVMLDRDLAEMFNTETRIINQQVKRNAGRFGEGYSFKLNYEEFKDLREILKSQNVISNWGGVRYPPTAFTEKGIYMVSTVLRSETADLVAMYIVDIFTETNKILNENIELKQSIVAIEKEAAEKNKIIKTLSLIAQEINKQKMEPGLIIAAISATMQAIDLWKKSRDKNSTKEAFSKVESLKDSPEIQEEANQLRLLIRPDILDSFENRIQICMNRYKKVIDSVEFLPQELDEATEALLKCICRELNRILKINGEIPNGVLKDYWEQYNCESKR